MSWGSRRAVSLATGPDIGRAWTVDDITHGNASVSLRESRSLLESDGNGP